MSILPFFTISDFNLAGKTVLLRLDINSPIDPRTGSILDDTRFRAHITTIDSLANSKVVILAHQSRPGKDDFISLKAHASHLSTIIGKKVKFVPGLFEENVLEAIDSSRTGEIIMLENTRFYSEEVVLADENIDVIERTHIVKNLSSHADYFVNDAFAAAHRSNVTLVGFSRLIPNIAGKLMEAEVAGIEKFYSIKEGKRIGIFGGSKADDSIKIIDRMLREGKVDMVATGGLVGHIFLMASGLDMGKKNEEVLKKEVGNYEVSVKKAQEILERYGEKVMMPVDFVGNDNGKPRHYTVSDFRRDIPAMDIGVDTIANYVTAIKESSAIMLNGPMGVFELRDYASGTEEVFMAVARSGGYKVAGGGHTIAALERLGITDRDIQHISTGGGALISFLAGEKMPGIESLTISKKKFGGN
ncbi:MAG: phosphoglycerate kinase [Thermoplasmatales archaeon]